MPLCVPLVCELFVNAWSNRFLHCVSVGVRLVLVRCQFGQLCGQVCDRLPQRFVVWDPSLVWGSGLLFWWVHIINIVSNVVAGTRATNAARGIAHIANSSWLWVGSAAAGFNQQFKPSGNQSVSQWNQSVNSVNQSVSQIYSISQWNPYGRSDSLLRANSFTRSGRIHSLFHSNTHIHINSIIRIRSLI